MAEGRHENSETKGSTRAGNETRLPALDAALLGARMPLVDKSGWGGARKAQFPPF